MASYVGPFGANITARVRQFKNYAHLNLAKAVLQYHYPQVYALQLYRAPTVNTLVQVLQL